MYFVWWWEYFVWC